jgi:hypothetical protein
LEGKRFSGACTGLEGDGLALRCRCEKGFLLGSENWHYRFSLIAIEKDLVYLALTQIKMGLDARLGPDKYMDLAELVCEDSGFEGGQAVGLDEF